MRKIVWTLAALLLILSSCAKSNEEKAEALIKENLQQTLPHPESYKPISTVVDSAFFDVQNLMDAAKTVQELAKLLQLQVEYNIEVESAMLSMDTNTPTKYSSEFERKNYNDVKEKYDKYAKFLKKNSSQITASIKNLKESVANMYGDEHSCWVACHKFSAMNKANTANETYELIFFCDKDFTRCGDGMMKQEFEKLMTLFDNIYDAEDEDEVIEIFNHYNYYF